MLDTIFFLSFFFPSKMSRLYQSSGSILWGIVCFGLLPLQFYLIKDASWVEKEWLSFARPKLFFIINNSLRLVLNLIDKSHLSSSKNKPHWSSKKFQDQLLTCQYNLFHCKFAQERHLYQKPPKQSPPIADFSMKIQKIEQRRYS